MNFESVDAKSLFSDGVLDNEVVISTNVGLMFVRVVGSERFMI